MPQAEPTTRIKVLATIGRDARALARRARPDHRRDSVAPHRRRAQRSRFATPGFDHRYLVASTVVVPLAGKLGDLFGRKPFLIGGHDWVVRRLGALAAWPRHDPADRLPGPPGSLRRHALRVGVHRAWKTSTHRPSGFRITGPLRCRVRSLFDHRPRRSRFLTDNLAGAGLLRQPAGRPAWCRRRRRLPALRPHQGLLARHRLRRVGGLWPPV